MTANKYRGDYSQLNQIAQSFTRQAEANRQILQRIQGAIDVLRTGDWVGKGADAFYQEMDSAILPSLKRLIAALEDASQVTLKIARRVKQAEDDAAALFRIVGAGVGGAAAAGAAAGAGGSGAAAGTGAGAGAGTGAAGPGGSGSGAATGGSGKQPGRGAVASVTLQQARQIFRDMANESDIAFNYPLDGCYARAHIMSRRIAQRYGVTPSKAWAFGDLRVSTATPYGQVEWGYHVAPAIPVSQPDGSTQMMVIDPSIADGPVTAQRWAEIMNATGANTQISGPGKPPNDPDTGQPLPGTGYWPGADPTRFGGPDGYSAEVMRRYRECGNNGAQCRFVPAN